MALTTWNLGTILSMSEVRSLARRFKTHRQKCQRCKSFKLVIKKECAFGKLFVEYWVGEFKSITLSLSLSPRSYWRTKGKFPCSPRFTKVLRSRLIGIKQKKMHYCLTTKILLPNRSHLGTVEYRIQGITIFKSINYCVNWGNKKQKIILKVIKTLV